MSGLLLRYLYLPDEVRFIDNVEFLPFLSLSRQERIPKFRFDRDKLVSLATGLLIRYCVAKDTGGFPEQLEFQYGEYGKPYVAYPPDYFFSVSHSHNAVIFAGSDSAIGVDIEKITEDNKSAVQIAKDYFTCDEAEYIENAEQKEKHFFEVWTRKEAYVKCLGTGLYTPLESFSVLKENKEKQYITFQEKDYMISVYCDKKYSGVSVEQISFEKIRQFYKAKNIQIKL